MAWEVKWAEAAWSAEFHDTSIRELSVRSYRLIYQVAEQVVYIIGFVHGARNLLALWEREGRPPPGDIC